MTIAVGRWYRNKTSGVICQCVTYASPWVSVMYQSCRRVNKFHSAQFLKGFESIAKPA